MTYLEHFEKTSSNENMSWCKPFTDRNEEYFLLMHDGEISEAKTPEGIFYRRSMGYGMKLTDEVLESIARIVNSEYDSYSHMTDENIALDAMHELGCVNCPFRHECEAVNEEMEEE